MPGPTRNLGILRPIGGGDPIPLLKDEIIIGRRSTCDISLDFENISGKHCVLKFIKGVWHIRDLNSTNGTFLNRQRVAHDHGVMPDDELRLATHQFSIDYDPIAPTSLVDANQVLEEEIAQASRSLTELAGIEVDPESRQSRLGRTRKQADESGRQARERERERERDRELERDHDRAATSPEVIDSVPEDYMPAESKPANDDDFFGLIEEDLKK